jgi:hypothetical protein
MTETQFRIRTNDTNLLNELRDELATEDMTSTQQPDRYPIVEDVRTNNFG